MLATRVKTLYKYASVTRTTLHFAVGKKLTSHLNLASHAGELVFPLSPHIAFVCLPKYELP